MLISLVIRMGFSSPQYQFSEGAGSLPESVYIEKENAVTVSSNFTVTVVLQTTSTASYSKLFFQFQRRTLHK